MWGNSVLLTVVAFFAHALVPGSLLVRGHQQRSLRPLPIERDRLLTRIFFIGDTHGDSHCTQEWIRRTGLVNFDSEPWQWTGNSTSDALVFLGDYVDKVLEYSSALNAAKTQ